MQVFGSIFTFSFIFFNVLKNVVFQEQIIWKQKLSVPLKFEGCQLTTKQNDILFVHI